MSAKSSAVLMLLCILAPAGVLADELTQMIQKDLVILGYEPGNTDGEATVQTAVAISKFQAEHDLEVTGEATPQLAGVIKAAIDQQNAPAAAVAAAPQASAQPKDPAAQQAAQQACLQQKMEAREASNRKKRGFGSLMRVASRTAARSGGNTATEIARTTHDVYEVNATVSDLESAARDLGITETELEECRNASQ
ncbi:MAG TPA: peptidoglycan-binding domain-containing protein [Woeseiaceae bacterium]|nr:peptidoglycan-binding domain-containing protein [Woeseiaceae bacterium]